MRQKISDATLDLEYHSRIVRLFINDDQIALIEKLRATVEEIRINVSKGSIARRGPDRPELDKELSNIFDTIFSDRIA
jgi:hypothetical protein